MVLRKLAGSCLLLITLLACGGDSPSPSPAPPAPPPAPPPATDACATGLEGAAADSRTRSDKYAGRVDNNEPRYGLLEARWLHLLGLERGLRLPLASDRPAAEDVGEIAVLDDRGDLIARANAFDLQGRGLRFTRNGQGGYDVGSAAAALRSPIGSVISLQDDDSRAVDLPFQFTFYGQAQGRVFVNSDGNLTFESGDSESTDRSVTRFLVGVPRVAPFFADLDPSVGSGRIYGIADANGYTVTWCGVRGFDRPETVTVQVTLEAGGGIEFRYGGSISLGDAVVGLSPGRSGDFTAVDLTASGSSAAGGVALGERFSVDPDIDLVAVARRFYQTHPDSYDQLVIWTDARVVSGNTFAYETTVANEVRGVGIDVFDAASEFGSAGRLRSLVMMDAITKYPANPRQKFLGENNTVSVLGQETGHRWLAFMRFRDHDGRSSDELLGRQEAHWSFFMDSDASVMEGNDIEDLGGGSFRTAGAVSRFSMLDQYAMGLVGENDVPPFFYVESPTNVRPDRDREDDPEPGVTFNGTRRDVLIGDVVAVMGRRQPSAASSPRVHRQAFIFVVSAGGTPDAAQIDKVDRIRREWTAFFRDATSGRMTAETRLR